MEWWGERELTARVLARSNEECRSRELGVGERILDSSLERVRLRFMASMSEDGVERVMERAIDWSGRGLLLYRLLTVTGALLGRADADYLRRQVSEV